MARKATIGDNPLDALISQPSGRTATLEREQPQEGGKILKVRATFHLPVDLLEEARDAAVHLSGPPNRLTLAEFAENAFRHEIERLKKDHNGNKSFPKRQHALRGGRPIGS